jgi:predicted outer membrane repeat protein
VFEHNNAYAGSALSGGNEVVRCLFIDNPDSAVRNVPSATDCTFTGNTGHHGAAVQLTGGAPTFTRCEFLDNVAESEGGAVHTDEAPATFIDCLFSDNEAPEGGAVFAERCSVSFSECRFLGNSGFGRGGAILAQIDATIDLVNCLLTGNYSDMGGGLYVKNNTFVDVVNCSFAGNTSILGGGIFIADEGDPAGLSADNCILTQNSGLQFYVDSGSAATFRYSCIEGGWGCPWDLNGDGVVYSDDEEILMEHFGDCPDPPAECPWDFTGDGVVDELDRNELLEHWGPCPFGGPGNIDADPLFVDPDGPDDIFGTEDDDLRLSPGSPCIDAGDNNAVPPNVTTDLDGNLRFVDDPDTEDTGQGDPPIVDMGAYEYQAETCPAEFDGDGDVDTADLLFLLAAWGTPDGDVDGDGDTDTADLLALLAAWGECPQGSTSQPLLSQDHASTTPQAVLVHCQPSARPEGALVPARADVPPRFP